jgi:DMSO/TMAO reductase YedYZ molybdopterin-dependent catalytic subunit
MPPKTPKPKSLLTRRETLLRLIAGGGALSLAGCTFNARDPQVLGFVDSAEKLTQFVQRALLAPREALAPEFSKSDISSYFRPNGSTAPDDPDYLDAVASNFANWKLEVGGLVENPLMLSLADLRALPARTQITRHDCVEGWSCIGEWTGVPLMSVLTQARLKPEARFIVFYCADQLEQTLDGTGQYYETIDLIDAAHPQTILAYAMNGAPLPVDHGAPLRLRVERQLGYKMAKYVMKIEAIDSFAELGRGNGGFWEDRGYDWYAGI